LNLSSSDLLLFCYLRFLVDPGLYHYRLIILILLPSPFSLCLSGTLTEKAIDLPAMTEDIGTLLAHP
jgi:hypothetical protein